jgi:hypothetical protein
MKVTEDQTMKVEITKVESASEMAAAIIQPIPAPSTLPKLPSLSQPKINMPLNPPKITKLPPLIAPKLPKPT